MGLHIDAHNRRQLTLGNNGGRINFTPGVGAAGSNVLPTDVAVAALAGNPASATAVAQAAATAALLDNPASALVAELAARYGINIISLGADPTGVVDATTIIQGALDAAAAGLGRNMVYVPTGTYAFTQLEMRYGVRLIGSGIGGFGTDGETYGSRLFQIAGTLKHGIVLRTSAAGGDGITRFGAFEIANLEITGRYQAGYCGIAARRHDTGGEVMLIDLSQLHHLSMRNWGSHGIDLPGGMLPGNVHHIHGLFNGGYLINYSPGTLGGITEMVSFDQISGDGNISGLIGISGQNAMGPFHLTNIKSERRTNPNGTPATGQDSAIVFTDCAGLTAKVDSLSHQTSVDVLGVREKPGPAIKIITGSPRLEWSNVIVRVNAGAVGGGTPATVYDVATGYTVPIDVPRGTIGGGEAATHVDVPGWFSGALTKVRRVIGWHTPRGDASSPTLSPALHLDGPTPGIVLYETDAAADEKAWIIRADGGQFVVRTVSDAGGLGEQVMLFDRVGNAVDLAYWQAHLVPLTDFAQSLGTDALSWNQVCARDFRLQTNTLPAASSADRGSFRYVAGGAGVADQVVVCVKDAADAYAWVTVI